ncbi:MAG: polyprenyl synthetase family protein, partial [Ruthenibacterium sp.]
MKSSDYKAQYSAYLTEAEGTLNDAMQQVLGDASDVSKAAAYSLMAGGKRTRAVLCLAVCDMLGGSLALAAQYAAAVEMLHCYSLIHDDLPCMDNDDYRRGQLSCHKKYGETTALLAGDALLTAAFETLSSAQGSALQNMQGVAALSRAAGAKGMIYGQELDLHFEHTPATEEQLREIHRNKTGMLIHAAAVLGGIAANASDADKERISQYAFTVGLVFQIVDDVLDVTATTETLGKPVGSDAQSDKTTFVKLFGVEKSLAMARQDTEQACAGLQERFGSKAQFLINFANALVVRH